MKFQYNDGGRAEAGFKGSTGDCVVRAIAIASGKPYIEVYNDLFALNKEFASTSRSRTADKVRAKGGTPRNGSFRTVYEKYILSLGAEWVPTMSIGSGCKVHMRDTELPHGSIIVRVSKHLSAVINGVINDTYDCSRQGTRCVYGYYIFKK